MATYVRLHRNQHVDAVVSFTGAGNPPLGAPGDVLLVFSDDINPSKQITVQEPVQATDPVTNAPLFNADGTPKYEQVEVLDASGKPIPVIDPSTGKPEVDAKGNPVYEMTTKMQDVQKTVTLLTDPTQFTEADFAGLEYFVHGSLEHKKHLKKQELLQDFGRTLLAGFTSSADGTARTYDLDATAYSRINGYLAIVNAGKGQTSRTWYDINKVATSFTTTQFIQFADDAFTFYDAKYANLKTKETDVDNATDESAVDAVTF